MLNFFKNLFDFNQKEINRLKKQVDLINILESEIRVIKDEDFIKETVMLKSQLESGSTLDELLPRAYALVRESARRTLGERHFDVQLMAGIGLHEGKIIEQKTGEGKTLSATTALYLNALSGKGAHLVTVNDYLARRDAGWMGKVFHMLGLKTAVIISDRSYAYDNDFTDSETQDWRLIHLKKVSRKEAYNADITYGINSEFGFDYLRDNMATNPGDLVQRGFNFAIIDEADSVLIDEARTPHIISAPYDEDTSKYYEYAKMVAKLDPQIDYKIDEKSRTANLTEEGVRHIERLIGVENVYEKDFDTLFHIEAALKAVALFRNNKDYIVREGEIVIVDEFTGRLLEGRRFSEGIHQAIEAKEKVAIQRESKTLATVSLQNYFRMYRKIGGMTGTASTEAEEFHKIYKADVLTAPTHRPMVRKDHADMIYKTEKGKWNAVVEEIALQYKVGRPVLVGTTSIEKNELLSSQLREKGIPHELLNAKNHEREATIISAAGKKGAVTVATNMAGRGVDIILGGAPPQEKDKKSEWQKSHDEVVSLGGLYVLGTERHESRRIDNQLRGRAGRQGDPGETRFFVSLEDDLMRIFGGEQISNLMTFFNFPENEALSHSMVSKAIEQAQVKVEGFNFDIRKHLVDYDDVLNKQRDIIYARRRKILHMNEEKRSEFKEVIIGTLKEEVNKVVAQFSFEDTAVTDEEFKNMVSEMHFIYHFDEQKLFEFANNHDVVGMQRFAHIEIEKAFNAQEEGIGKEIWFEIVKSVYLSTIDKYWTDHLTSIEDLREGINLRGFAQMDPLIEYKNEAFSMFEKLIDDIDFEVSRRLFKVEVSVPNVPHEQKKPASLTFKSAAALDPFTAPPPGSQPAQDHNSQQPQGHQHENHNNSTTQTGGYRVTLPGQSEKKPGRNEPCWCGSGKKYKKCHFPN